MEDNKTGSTSDRDKKMMGSFESYADRKDREKKEAEEKKRLKPFPSLFEQLTKDDEKVEKEEEKSNKLEDLFVTKSETETEETEETADTEEPAKEEPAEAEEAAEQPETVEAETTEETGEVEAPIDELTEEETQMAIDQYVEANKSEVETEAENRLLENIQEKGSVEDGYDATLEELELNEEDLEDSEADAEAEAEDDTELEPADTEIEDDEEDLAVVPPAPPTPPTPPMPPVPPGPVMPPGPNFNAQPPQPIANANRLGNQFNTDPGKKYQRGADLLVGGLIGYLLGRRRGRINTEAELLPIQNKLEKQVNELYEDIAEKEKKIRKLAAVKQEQAEAPVLTRRLEDEDQQEAMTRRSFESANRTDYQKVNPEQLGRFVVPPVEIAAEKTPDVDSLGWEQLLDIAANIKRDDISLKQMFENGRLDAEGLRRVIREYLSGDHFERVLNENLKNVETHETDPLTRNQPSLGTFGGGGFGQATGLRPDAPSGSIPTPQPAAANPYHYQSPELKRQAAATGIAIGFGMAIVILILLALFA